MNIEELLIALGFTGADHDANVREALLELRHARVSLSEFRKDAKPHVCPEGHPFDVERYCYVCGTHTACRTPGAHDGER